VAEVEQALGKTLDREGKLSEAELCFERAWEAVHKLRSGRDPQLVECVWELTSNYIKQKKLSKAIDLGTVYFKEHPSLKSRDPIIPGLLRAYAHACADSGKFKQAETFQRKLLTSLKNQYGEDSDKLVRPMRFLAAIYRQLRQPEQSVLLLQRAMPLVSKTAHTEVPDEMAQVGAELSDSYVCIMRMHHHNFLAQAEQSDQQILRALRKKRKRDPMSEAIILSSLAPVHMLERHPDLAERALKEGVDLLDSNFEKYNYRSMESHKYLSSVYVTISNSYAALLRARGRNREADKRIELANTLKDQEGL
jgi:tetratricopeptide (TPR) repeat protein